MKRKISILVLAVSTLVVTAFVITAGEKSITASQKHAGGGGGMPNANFRRSSLRINSGTTQLANDGATNGVRKLNFVQHPFPNPNVFTDTNPSHEAANKNLIRNYTDALLLHNSDQLSFATANSGTIAHKLGDTPMSDVYRGDNITSVNYHQMARLSDNSLVPVIGTAVTFIYANKGENGLPYLSQVKALTYNNVDGLAPATISYDDAPLVVTSLSIPGTVKQIESTQPVVDPSTLLAAPDTNFTIPDDEDIITDPELITLNKPITLPPTSQPLVTRNSILTPETATVHQLGVYVQPNDIPRLAYEIAVEGPLRLFDQTSGAEIIHQYFDYQTQSVKTNTLRGSYVLYIEAHSGALLKSVEAMAHSQPGYAEVGTGQVYDPSPMEGGGQLFQVPLYDLADMNTPNDGYLRSPFVRIQDVAIGDVYCPKGTSQSGNLPPGCTGLNFIFNPVGIGFYAIQQVNAFHFLSDRKAYLNALGFGNLMNFPITTVPVDNMHLGSYYDAINKSIGFLGGNSDALDGDIAAHEYGHAVTNDLGLQTGNPGQYNYPFALGDDVLGNGAWNEAIADYHAASNFNDIEIGEQTGQFLPNGYLRKLNSSENIVDNWHGEKYADSVIISTALYRLRNTLGKGIVDPIVFELPAHVLPTDNVQQIVEAFRQAANVLYPGAGGYSVYDENIRAIFSLAKLNGVSGAYNWSSRVGSGLAYLTPRPYPDTYNHTEIRTIAGASFVRIMFDLYSMVNEHDFIQVRDGNDVLIAAFTGVRARNEVVTVPGDTVKITLNSAPDGVGGAGYGLVFVQAYDPTIPNSGPIVQGSMLPVTPGSTMSPLPVRVDVSASYDPNGDAIVGWKITPQRGLAEPMGVFLDPLIPGSFNKTVTHILNRKAYWPITVPGYVGARIELVDSKGNKSLPTYVGDPAGGGVYVTPYVAP